ncbi:hypothetical protein JW826_06390 [Candidatus Woesearchaeota archaeon]|nr:hypothetical protein [Candidatus Woesearchaeota archaeon]
MRRREKEKKSEKTKQIVMSSFLALVMILSVFGIIIGSQSSELKYGKYKFERKDNYYTTKIDGKELYFYTLPFDTSYINLSDETVDKIRSSAYLITSFNAGAANESLPAIELVRYDLANLLPEKFIFDGVEEPHPLYEALSVLGCANATLGAPALIFNISDSMSIVDAGDCIYFNGRGADFLRLRDRLLYSYYGVYDDAEQQ